MNKEIRDHGLYAFISSLWSEDDVVVFFAQLYNAGKDLKQEAKRYYKFLAKQLNCSVAESKLLKREVLDIAKYISLFESGRMDEYKDPFKYKYIRALMIVNDESFEESCRKMVGDIDPIELDEKDLKERALINCGLDITDEEASFCADMVRDGVFYTSDEKIDHYIESKSIHEMVTGGAL